MKRDCLAAGCLPDGETISFSITTVRNAVKLYHNTPTRGELMRGSVTSSTSFSAHSAQYAVFSIASAVYASITVAGLPQTTQANPGAVFRASSCTGCFLFCTI